MITIRKRQSKILAYIKRKLGLENLKLTGKIEYHRDRGKEVPFSYEACKIETNTDKESYFFSVLKRRML